MAHAQANPARAVLFVLYDINFRREPEVSASGGEVLPIEPWILEPGRLTPIQYSYALH